MPKQVKKSHQIPRCQPDSFAVYTDSAGRSWEVAVEYKIINGRPDVAAFTVRSSDLRAPISQRLLREIPLEALFKKALATEVGLLSRSPRARRSSTAHQGRPHSDHELKSVADIYVSAFNARVPVQQAVANALGVSVSTAAKRIMAARKQGYIPTPSNEDDQ